VRAPPLEIPVPFKVRASAVAKEKPFKSRTAPELTVVPAPVVPNGVLLPLPAAPRSNVPALIVVAPVYVFAPVIVQVPVPSLVKVPEVVPKILANVPPVLPPSVRPKVAPVMVPVLLMFIAPVPPTMLLALPRVIKPPKVAPVDELFMTAPPEEIPVPLMVRASADE